MPLALGLLVLITSLCGCGYILHKLAPAGKGKLVPAENEALSQGKKVLILVYADENIQYQHKQLARYRTSTAIAKQLQSQLKVLTVDPAIVEKFQASDMTWADRQPSQIGWEQYRAELVLYVELKEFTTTEESEDFLKGRIEGNCSLYTAAQWGGQAELLWQKTVSAVYPPGIPRVARRGSAVGVRDETVKLFAENLVKNFYGHHEPY